MAEISCKHCSSLDCRGCNIYRLEQMLDAGKLETLMNENRVIQISADVRPVVRCKDCKSCNTNIAVGGWYGICAFWNGHSVMADDYCSRFQNKDSADMREVQGG